MIRWLEPKRDVAASRSRLPRAPASLLCPGSFSARSVALAAVALSLSLVGAQSARAQAGATPINVPAPGTPSQERQESGLSASTEFALRQLESELDLHARNERRARISRGITSLALGAALLPTGIVLERGDVALKRLTGIGLVVGGSVELVNLPTMIFPSDVERLRAHHLERRASGKSDEVVLQETEREWQRTAQKERKTRNISGIAHLSIGAALLPVGLTLLCKHRVSDWSLSRQMNIASTLVGIGTGFVALGSQLLYRDGDAQSSWEEHARVRPPARGLAATRWGLAPLAHGGVLAASGAF